MDGELYPDSRDMAEIFPIKETIIIDENLSWAFVKALALELMGQEPDKFELSYVNDSSNRLGLHSGMRDEKILEKSREYPGSKIVTKDKDFRYFSHAVVICGNGHESPNALRSYVFQVMAQFFDGNNVHAELLKYIT